jgi:hypothetical protein
LIIDGGARAAAHFVCAFLSRDPRDLYKLYELCKIVDTTAKKGRIPAEFCSLPFEI